MLDNDIYKTIVENSKDAILFIDKKASITYCNNAVKEIYHYNPDEMINKNLFNLLTAPDYRDFHNQSFQHYVNDVNSNNKTFEIASLNKNGEELVVEISISKCVYKDEPYCISIVRDVSERKEIENTLKEFQEIFHTITDTAHDAIIMIDNEGKISYWNQAAERMFGYEFIEALDQDAGFLLLPDKYQTLFEDILSSVQKLNINDTYQKLLETEAVRKDGTKFSIQLLITALKINNSWNAIANVHSIFADHCLLPD